MDVEKCHNEFAVEDPTRGHLAGEDSTEDTWIHASPFSAIMRNPPMKLILSRKGFDSSPAYGACASPILPDGEMISLPIPHQRGTTTFDGLRHRGIDVGQLVSELTGGRVKGADPAHLDPDLDPTARPRHRGWRAAFGQDSAAQRHLERQGVGAGDLFLFFGWFREVVKVRGRYGYRPGAPDRHVLFGWLRVGRVLRPGPDRVPPWLRDHPHAAHDSAPHNTIYLADDAAGAGVFRQFRPDLQLTDAGSRQRSLWRMPADFLPGARPPLTYHRDPTRWGSDGKFCRLQSVAKGQEFVLDMAAYPGVQRWTRRLLGKK